MKNFEHIKEVQAEIRNTIPIIGEVVMGVRNRFKGVRNQFIEPFLHDQEKLPNKNQDLTAVFSRDKEYLFDLEQTNFFTQSIKSRVIEFILKRKRFSPEDVDDFSFGIERALSDGIYTAAYPLHDVSTYLHIFYYVTLVSKNNLEYFQNHVHPLLFISMRLVSYFLILRAALQLTRYLIIAYICTVLHCIVK